MSQKHEATANRWCLGAIFRQVLLKSSVRSTESCWAWWTNMAEGWKSCKPNSQSITIIGYLYIIYLYITLHYIHMYNMIYIYNMYFIYIYTQCITCIHSNSSDHLYLVHLYRLWPRWGTGQRLSSVTYVCSLRPDRQGELQGWLVEPRTFDWNCVGYFWKV